MNLLEHQGKDLFQQYNIPIPSSHLVTPRTRKAPLLVPFILKSQVPVGDRFKKGGIAIIKQARSFAPRAQELFRLPIDGYLPQVLLAEQIIDFTKELYISFSFSTAHRGPILALSAKGGTGIATAHLTPFDITNLPAFQIREALLAAKLPLDRSLIAIITSLWNLFSNEQALLAEINPLFLTKDGTYVAGDAKIILDDNIIDPGQRPYIDLPGDIAVIASGGGASMINLDALLQAGGKPANYVEYSGNPKSGIVTELTQKVLSKPGLKGCWVIGGTANFTDIYATLQGFVDGLRQLPTKPTYPIVIRRDGPRQKEAFQMLTKVATEEGYDFHLFGPETSMTKSAKEIVKLSYGHSD